MPFSPMTRENGKTRDRKGIWKLEISSECLCVGILVCGNKSDQARRPIRSNGNFFIAHVRSRNAPLAHAKPNVIIQNLYTNTMQGCGECGFSGIRIPDGHITLAVFWPHHLPSLPLLLSFFHSLTRFLLVPFHTQTHTRVKNILVDEENRNVRLARHKSDRAHQTGAHIR